MSDELMPCPFCGGEKVSVELGLHGYFAVCYMCNSKSSNVPTQQDAMDRWNKRQSLHALAKALDDEADDIEKHAPFAGTAIREARAQGKTVALRDVAKRLRGGK